MTVRAGRRAPVSRSRTPAGSRTRHTLVHLAGHVLRGATRCGVRLPRDFDGAGRRRGSPFSCGFEGRAGRSAPDGRRSRAAPLGRRTARRLRPGAPGRLVPRSARRAMCGRPASGPRRTAVARGGPDGYHGRPSIGSGSVLVCRPAFKAGWAP